MHLQDLFLEHVRGFKAQEVPADWHEQLMVVAEKVGGEKIQHICGLTEGEVNLILDLHQ